MVNEKTTPAGRKSADFDRNLELKIFIMFMLLFIVPSSIMLSSPYLCHEENSHLGYIAAVSSVMLILIRIFFYTKRLDRQDEMLEKYD